MSMSTDDEKLIEWRAVFRGALVGLSILVPVSALEAILDRNIAYAELGPDYLHRRQDPEQQTRRLVRQLERLGHTVTLQTTEAA